MNNNLNSDGITTGMVNTNIPLTNGTTWNYIPQYKYQGDINMVQSPTIVKVAGALLRAQKNMGNASKDSKNPFFKSNYANLNSVREVAHPALNAEGVVILQPTLTIDGKNYVRTLLLHESGEYLGSDTEIICAKQNDPQAYGSAISYSRRYGLQSLMSIGAEDSDAEGAMNRPSAVANSKPWASSITAASAPVASGTVTAPTVVATAPATPIKANGSFKKPQAAKKVEAPAADASDWD
jgi:hypothetical protein